MLAFTANSGHRDRCGIDRVHRALESVLEEIAKHLVADVAGVPPGTDHRDPAWREQPGDRR